MAARETRDLDRDRLDFHHVYAEFRGKIHRYLKRLVGPTDAEDVTQDTFAKVSQALPQFREDSSVSTWIYRIATNAAYDRLRTRSSHGAHGVPIDELQAVEDKGPGADQRLARREMNACIDDYVARLPASYRSVVILSEHEGLTNKEIADALGVTLDTVKIRLHRARARLRKDLGDGCDFYRDDRNEFACEPKMRRCIREGLTSVYTSENRRSVMTLDNRITELIALGASVAANCPSCVEYHGRKAVDSSVDPDEVAQAIEIGRTVRKGAAANVDRVTAGLLQKDASRASGTATPGAPASHAGCSGSAATDETPRADRQGESTCFPNRCRPFSSMMTGAWRSGGSPFPGPGEAKS